MTTPLGLTPRDLIGLVRDGSAAALPSGVIAVAGVRAAELADALARGGDRSLVRVTTDAVGAAALVCGVDGAATSTEEAAMRTATRAGAPVVAVQFGDPSTRLPYALPGDTIEAAPGAPLPLPRIVAVLAEALRGEGVPFAAGLPVLRGAVLGGRARDAALTAGALAALRRAEGPMLPVLALAQARLLRELSVGAGGAAPAGPQGLASSLGPELGAALATGLACRSLARRVPLRSRLTDGLVAFAGTTVLATAAGRLRSA